MNVSVRVDEDVAGAGDDVGHGVAGGEVLQKLGQALQRLWEGNVIVKEDTVEYGFGVI